MSFRRRLTPLLIGALLATSAGAAWAQTPPGELYGAKPGTPDLSGVWFLIAKRGVNWAPLPKYKPKYEADRLRRVAADKAGKPIADNGSRCLPPGMPATLILSGYPTEIIETPGRVTIIKENLAQVLRVWTDGRPQVTDPDPNFLGHSVGHWEGQDLVVDTVGLREGSLLDVARTMPHSDALHLTLRFHKLDPNTLQLNITAEDPIAFEGKTEAISIFEKRDQWEVMEHYCEAPGFEVDADGSLSALPTAAQK